LEYADQNTINKLNNGDAGYSINGVCEAIKEHLGKGEMTKIGIAKKQPYQQVNNIPEQTSPTSLSSPVSVARQKAKEKASKKIGIELPQDLVERVDVVLSTLEDIEQAFPQIENHIYIYEAVHFWQNAKRDELMLAEDYK
jgi:hypothetical protein